VTEWWEAVLPFCRPGSRTVLCDPQGDRLAIELARRGYRLLILHNGSFDTAGLRQKLRELSLSSQLMGSHIYREGPSLGLVVDFYELWIFCAVPTSFTLAMKALKTGAPIYWQASLWDDYEALPSGSTPISGLPEGLLGVFNRS
jgi:hypothetical protein